MRKDGLRFIPLVALLFSCSSSETGAISAPRFEIRADDAQPRVLYVSYAGDFGAPDFRDSSRMAGVEFVRRRCEVGAVVSNKETEQEIIFLDGDPQQCLRRIMEDLQ